MPRTLMTSVPSERRAPGARGGGSLAGVCARAPFLPPPRRHFDKHLARGELAVTERRVQVLGFAIAVFRRHLIDLGLGYLAQLDAQPARFLVQVFLADL